MLLWFVENDQFLLFSSWMRRWGESYRSLKLDKKENTTTPSSIFSGHLAENWNSYISQIKLVAASRHSGSAGSHSTRTYVQVYQSKNNAPQISHSKPKKKRKRKTDGNQKKHLWLSSTLGSSDWTKEVSSCSKKLTEATKMADWWLFCILSSQPSLWRNTIMHLLSKWRLGSLCIQDAKQLQVTKRPLAATTASCRERVRLLTDIFYKPFASVWGRNDTFSFSTMWKTNGKGKERKR